MWLTLGWRWGISGIGRGGSTGVVAAGISLYLVWLSLSTYSLTVVWVSLVFVKDPHFFFFFWRLDLLKWAGSLWEEAQQLEMEGLQKITLAVPGSKVEGLYRLLRGAVAHSPMSSTTPHTPKCHHIPSAPSEV